jgi:hypothetical protein
MALRLEDVGKGRADPPAAHDDEVHRLFLPRSTRV